jgi:shikimate 5-dehydrogenase
MNAPYAPASRATMYFIGVSTGQSSIMKVFPEWVRYLGLGRVAMLGIDFRPHAPGEAYREAVEFLKGDPLSRGALVTTHKIDLYAACRDLFDEIDPFARTMGETSCLSKQDRRLICHAKDPISSGLPWRLVFLRQARAQNEARHLQVEDGWTYFIHGWTRVIAEVFHIDTRGPEFDRISQIAASVR